MNVGYDILGNIAILKFDRKTKENDKRKFAQLYLKKNTHVKTVLEKTEKFKGRLRTLKTKYLAGEKSKEALYKENGCEFRFNVETCYFSPRLSSERLEIAKLVKKGENVLVMFGGVAPFAIAIGKRSKAGKIVSVELGKECNNYALANVKRNKLVGKVEIVQGDVRRVIGKGKKINERFDRIVMARPNLKDDFLDVAFPVIKKNGIIHYYGFYEENKVDDMKDLILKEAKKAKRKIKILKIKRAGDIGPYRFRYRTDVKVLN
jgi:tRNA (guanine37-N1)-methyltransferase